MSEYERARLAFQSGLTFPWQKCLMLIAFCIAFVCMHLCLS